MVHLKALVGAVSLLLPLASASWSFWGRDSANSRSNGNSLINSATVSNLKEAWIVTLGGAISATPTVDADLGIIYVVDQAGFVYSVNELDGSLNWKQNLQSLLGLANFTYSRTSPVIYNDLIILGLQGPGMDVALNFTDGSLVWKSLLDVHPLAVITMSPSIDGDVIYQGVSSLEEGAALNPAYPCCSFGGSMQALNATNGAVLWSTPMIPPSMVGIGKYAGNAVWGSSPPFDNQNVYIGTGNLYELPPDVAACQQACDDDPQSCAGKPPCVDPSIHFDSILALDKTTGVIQWATRLAATDAWTVACLFNQVANCPIPAGPDADFAQAPILISSNNLLVAGQKSGVAWGLDTTDGSIKWSTVAGPGGALGGFEWGSSLAYGPDGSVTWVGQVVNSRYQTFKMNSGVLWNGSVVVGLNPLTGDISWQVKQQNPIGDPVGPVGLGPISTTSDVAFAPAFVTGLLTALGAHDGAPLWQYKTRATLNCGPAITSDSIYFGDGYTATFNGTKGGNLYALRLPLP